jgi:hypothetical protein
VDGSLVSQHPHFGFTRHGGLPVHLRTSDHLAAPGAGWYKRVNAKIAVWTTAAVGSMTCAWLFAALAIAGLRTSLEPGNIGLLFWISSDFLQLTLLSVIMVGQNVAALAADARAAKTFEDAEITTDRLDTATKGGITDILTAVTKLGSDVSGLAQAVRSTHSGAAGERVAPPGAGPDIHKKERGRG